MAGISPQNSNDGPIEICDLPGYAYVFVCAHVKRDKRCGVAGPLLISEFEQSIAENGLDGSVHVYGVSHIGGHKFAGNVIVIFDVPFFSFCFWSWE